MPPMTSVKISCVVLAFSLIFISCSYQFLEPPFEDSRLVNITETEFGEELLSALKDLPEAEETAGIREGLDEDSLVLDVSEDFLIQQKINEETGAWELTVMTKNRHHIMFCSLIQQYDDDDGEVDIRFPELIESKKDHEGQIFLWGDKAAVSEFALELSLSSPKLCMAVPYQDASKLTTEVPVEVIVEKESSGSCNKAGSVSASTGATNSSMLFGPVLFLAAYGRYRKRK